MDPLTPILMNPLQSLTQLQKPTPKARPLKNWRQKIYISRTSPIVPLTTSYFRPRLSRLRFPSRSLFLER